MTEAFMDMTISMDISNWDVKCYDHGENFLEASSFNQDIVLGYLCNDFEWSLSWCRLLTRILVTGIPPQ